MHTQMKNQMLASLLLGCLLVMIALEDSLARVILSQKGTGNELYYVTGIATMSAQKGPIDPIGDVYVRNLGLGGKKLMSHEKASMESKNGKGAYGGTSEVSGEEKDAVKSIGRLKEPKEDQKEHMTMIAPKALNFTSFVIPRRSLPRTNSKRSQDSNAVPAIKASSLTSSSGPEQQISQEPQSTTQKEYETQNHLEAAKQIMDLIHKDYKGAASRRSPINNQEPKN